MLLEGEEWLSDVEGLSDSELLVGGGVEVEDEVLVGLSALANALEGFAQHSTAEDLLAQVADRVPLPYLLHEAQVCGVSRNHWSHLLESVMLCDGNF